MKPPSSELDLARIAFVAAHGRFQAAHADRNISAWYASLGETLWWIFAIDEHYRHANQAIYEELRNNDGNGRYISGLRLARNRVGHRLALMLQDPSGRSVYSEAPSEEGVFIDQLMWRTLTDLPPGDPGKESSTQENSYRKYLEGNAVRYALRHANYFFIRYRDDLDSVIL